MECESANKNVFHVFFRLSYIESIRQPASHSSFFYIFSWILLSSSSSIEILLFHKVHLCSTLKSLGWFHKNIHSHRYKFFHYFSLEQQHIESFLLHAFFYLNFLFNDDNSFPIHHEWLKVGLAGGSQSSSKSKGWKLSNLKKLFNKRIAFSFKI